MYKKIPYKSGEQVIKRFKAGDDAVALVNEDMDVAQAITALQENDLHLDLTNFIAHGLPVRESIWWAAICLEQRMDIWNPHQKQCIEIAKDWVRSPSEELRRKAELFANRLNTSCGPSWLAQAVFWNGSGSIVAPEMPMVKPDADLYAKAVGGAINHSSAIPDWDGREEFYKNAFDYAINIANGGNGKEAS